MENRRAPINRSCDPVPRTALAVAATEARWQARAHELLGVPKSMDSGATAPIGEALLVNAVLLAHPPSSVGTFRSR